MATGPPSACPAVVGEPTASPSRPVSPSLLGVTGGLSWPPSSLTPTGGAEASQSLLPVGGYRHIPRPDVERQRADPLLSQADSAQLSARPKTIRKDGMKTRTRNVHRGDRSSDRSLADDDDYSVAMRTRARSHHGGGRHVDPGSDAGDSQLLESGGSPQRIVPLSPGLLPLTAGTADNMEASPAAMAEVAASHDAASARRPYNGDSDDSQVSQRALRAREELARLRAQTEVEFACLRAEAQALKRQRREAVDQLANYRQKAERVKDLEEQVERDRQRYRAEAQGQASLRAQAEARIAQLETALTQKSPRAGAVEAPLAEAAHHRRESVVSENSINKRSGFFYSDTADGGERLEVGRGPSSTALGGICRLRGDTVVGAIATHPEPTVSHIRHGTTKSATAVCGAQATNRHSVSSHILVASDNARVGVAQGREPLPHLSPPPTTRVAMPTSGMVMSGHPTTSPTVGYADKICDAMRQELEPMKAQLADLWERRSSKRSTPTHLSDKRSSAGSRTRGGTAVTRPSRRDAPRERRGESTTSTPSLSSEDDLFPPTLQRPRQRSASRRKPAAPPAVPVESANHPHVEIAPVTDPRTYALGRVQDGRYTVYQGTPEITLPSAAGLERPPHSFASAPTAAQRPPLTGQRTADQLAPVAPTLDYDPMEEGPREEDLERPEGPLIRTQLQAMPFNPDSDVWQAWYSNFRLVAGNNGWSAAVQAQQLQALMRGRARTTLTAIPVAQRTYQACVGRLRATYAPKRQADEIITELRERRQEKGETFLQYRDALCTLALRAHGGDPDRTRWLITQFCEGLRNRDLSQRLLVFNPPTMLAAAEEATRLRRIAVRMRAQAGMVGRTYQSSSSGSGNSTCDSGTVAHQSWADRRNRRPPRQGNRHLQGKPFLKTASPTVTTPHAEAAARPTVPEPTPGAPLAEPEPQPQRPAGPPGKQPHDAIEGQMTEMIQCLKKLSIAVDALSASPTKPEARYRQPAATPERPCFRCHQLGHWARNCPLDKQPQRKVRLVTGAMGEGGSDDSDVDQAPILMVTPAPCEAEAQGLDDDDEPIIMGAVRGPREWYLMVTVAGATVPMLVDTGAVRTCLSAAAVMDHIPPGELDATRRLRLHSAGGDPLTVHGQWSCSLGVGDSQFPMRVVVCDLGGPQGLLGADFLAAYQARLHWLEGTLYLRGRPYQLLGKSPLRGGPLLSVVGFISNLTDGVTLEGEPSLIPPGSLASVSLHDGRASTQYLAVVGAGGTIQLPLPDRDNGREPPQGTEHILVADLSAVTLSGTPGDPEPDLVGDAPFEWQGDPSPAGPPVLAGGVALPAHLAGMVQDSELTGPDLTQLAEFVLAHEAVFVQPGAPLGQTDLAAHSIDTRDAHPIKVRARPIPVAKRTACLQQLEGMIADGIVTPSTSPWSAPVVMAHKKDGSLRFCIDYRELNSVTVKDSYPLPHMDDCLEALGGSHWYCTVDLASGF